MRATLGPRLQAAAMLQPAMHTELKGACTPALDALAAAQRCDREAVQLLAAAFQMCSAWDADHWQTCSATGAGKHIIGVARASPDLPPDCYLNN